jgi:hypothetical protein
MRRLAAIGALLIATASCSTVGTGDDSASGNGAHGGTGGEGGAQTGGIGGVAATGGASGSGASGGLGGVGGTFGSSGCTNVDFGLYATEYETQSTTVGQNGSFTDACDVRGNLIEYQCEVDTSGCTFPNPPPNCERITGDAVPFIVNCGGTCNAGACASHCAHPNDVLAYQSVDRATGAATLTNTMRDAVYVCELIWDRDTADYDCAADPVIGGSATAVSFGNATVFCLPGEMSTFGVEPQGTSDQECTYTCTTQ